MRSSYPLGSKRFRWSIVRLESRCDKVATNFEVFFHEIDSEGGVGVSIGSSRKIFASYATCCWVRGVSDSCGKLIAEGVGYFLVKSGLSIVKVDWLVLMNSRLLSGGPGDDSPKSSGVLCFLAGLNFAPPFFPFIFCD